MKNNIAEWLGLEEEILENINSKGDVLEISVSLPRKKHTCPGCGRDTDRVHDYRKQRVKDLRAFEKDVVLILRKRR